MTIDNLKEKRENLRLRKGENLRRRKETLFKKVYKVGKYDGVDVALILRQNGRYFTYRSIDLESWLLSIKEIVRLYYSFDITIYTNVKAASLIPCS
jgi:SRF-type transcription factor (DNA-binding and dimerisation domain)